MDNVLTLIANPRSRNLHADHVAQAASALETAGAAVGDADWLADAIACDLPFSSLDPNTAATLVANALAPAEIDAVAQKASERRKRLLVADMESTIIENEMLDELADEIGARDKIAAITARAMNGELDFEAALRERVALLSGLDALALDRAMVKIRIMSGARALVQTMRNNGAYCALVSGGFTYYTGHVRDRIGFDMDQANILEVENGNITGIVTAPILGRDAKRHALMRLCRERGVEPDDAIAVGDGANDLAMLTTAGAGVAFHAKPFVAEQASIIINHGDLTALLYMQGYRQSEIRT
ncbi:MAG: phosphoserine phosphatase SerB [Rhodospirillaceae bacterium]|nr:phosphoserine phosphatase SerB [Rhodospirillaceae bacterium]